jgi:hypothetical protein
MEVARSHGDCRPACLGARDEPFDHLIVYRLVNQDPRSGRAHLAAVEEDARAGGLDAASRSASGKMMLADLPPSSRVTRLRLPAAPRRIWRPTAGEPVKVTLSTSGWSTSAAPAVLPNPGTTLSTPGGNPAASASSPRRNAVSDVSSAGFSTTVQPQASAGAIFHMPIMSGKFHGTIAPTTPRGSRTV